MKYTGEKVMPSKRGFAANRMSCEAQFHSGHPADRTQPESGGINSFSGIFNQISKDTISSQYSQKNIQLSSSSDITVNLAVEIKDDIQKNEDEKKKDDITQQSADSLQNAYEQHPVVRLQNAWAFAAKSAVAAQNEKVGALTSNIIDNISKPKIRHFAKKRPRLSRQEKNRLRKKNRRGGSARKFKPMNSA